MIDLAPPPPLFGLVCHLWMPAGCPPPPPPVGDFAVSLSDPRHCSWLGRVELWAVAGSRGQLRARGEAEPGDKADRDSAEAEWIATALILTAATERGMWILRGDRGEEKGDEERTDTLPSSSLSNQSFRPVLSWGLKLDSEWSTGCVRSGMSDIRTWVYFFCWLNWFVRCWGSFAYFLLCQYQTQTRVVVTQLRAWDWSLEASLSTWCFVTGLQPSPPTMGHPSCVCLIQIIRVKGGKSEKCIHSGIVSPSFQFTMLAQQTSRTRTGHSHSHWDFPPRQSQALFRPEYVGEYDMNK